MQWNWWNTYHNLSTLDLLEYIYTRRVTKYRESWIIKEGQNYKMIIVLAESMKMIIEKHVIIFKKEKESPQLCARNERKMDKKRKKKICYKETLRLTFKNPYVFVLYCLCYTESTHYWIPSPQPKHTHLTSISFFHFVCFDSIEMMKSSTF